MKLTKLPKGKDMKLSRDAALFLRKALIYIAIIFMASLLQTSFLATLRPFGAVPDLMLLLALGAGYFRGAETGGIFGVASGVVAYAMGDIGTAFLPLLYMLVGVASGILVESFFAGKFAVWCLYVAGVAVLKSIYSLVCAVIFSGELQLWALIFKALLPEFIGTLILGMALYLPIKRLSKLL
jgi:hypothetical protein